MNKKQFSKYWWLKLLLALFVVASPLAACFPKEETTPAPPTTTPAPQPTAMPEGIGKVVITDREDLDPLTEGQQKGISVNFTLSVPDPKMIQYQYFEIVGTGGPVYVLNQYETPVGEVTLADFARVQVNFTKDGVNYVCPPVDANNPYVVDCRGVLSVLLSN